MKGSLARPLGGHRIDFEGAEGQGRCRDCGWVSYLDSVALNLHGFYSGLERPFELIARHVDGALSSGETWHRDLLQQMAQDIASIRPAVLS